MSADLATFRTEPSVPPSPPRSHGAAGREAPARAALPRQGRAWTAAFLALLSAAALSLSPPPARAQIHASNFETPRDDEAVQSGTLTGQDARILAQGFQVPAGGIELKSVALGLRADPDPPMRVLLYRGGGALTPIFGTGANVQLPDTLFHSNLGDDSAGSDHPFIMNGDAVVSDLPPDMEHPGLLGIFRFVEEDEGKRRFELDREFGRHDDGELSLAAGTYYVVLWTGDHRGPDWDQTAFLDEDRMTLDPALVQECPTDAGFEFIPYLEGRRQQADSDWDGDAQSYPRRGQRLLMEIIGEPNHPPTGRIEGDLVVGQTLRFEGLDDENGLPDALPGITYQWTRKDLDGENQEDIVGETSTEYELVSADRNRQIGVKVRGYVDDHCYDNDAEAATRDFEVRDHRPEGLPIIEGALEVGQTLTADTDGITDANGPASPIPPARFTYQWQRFDASNMWVDITTDGNDRMYRLTNEDATQIRVRVIYMDDANHEGRVVSLPTGVVNAPATGEPNFFQPSDGPLVGQELELMLPGTISDLNGLSRAGSGAPEDQDFAFEARWWRYDVSGENGVQILEADGSRATGDTYTLHRDDYGHRIGAVVHFRDDADHREMRPSFVYPEAMSGDAPMHGDNVVGRPANNLPSGAPRITVDGAPDRVITDGVHMGETLVADIRGDDDSLLIMDPDGLDEGPNERYRWFRVNPDDSSMDRESISCAPRTGEMNECVLTAGVLTAGGAGGPGDWAIEVEVTFEDDIGHDNSLSAFTPAVNVPATVVIEFRGQVAGGTLGYDVGDRLGADVGDPNGATGAVTYEWQRLDSGTWGVIGTDEEYTLAPDDKDGRVRVVVVDFTDDRGYPVTALASSEIVVGRGPNEQPTGLDVRCTPQACDDLAQPPQVGQTLEADLSQVNDVNGVGDDVRFGYQWEWQEVGSDPLSDPWADAQGQGASGTAGRRDSVRYTLTGEEGNRRVRLRVSFEDGSGYPASQNEVTSVLGLTVDTPAMVRVTGEVKVGEVLTASVEDGNDVASAAFTWQRQDIGTGTPNTWDDIGPGTPDGTSASTYTLDAMADGGSRVRVVVEVTDGAGYTQTLTSIPVQLQANQPAIVEVTGEAEVGEVLTAVVRDGNGTGGATLNYRWERVEADGTSSPTPVGTDSASYTLVDSDQDKRVRVTVGVFEDAAGYTEGPVTSAVTGQVLASAAAEHETRVKEWMGLFGRAVSEQVFDAVAQRLHSAPRAQQGEARLAGRRIRWTPGHEDDAFARNAVEAWFGSGDPRDWLGVRTLADEEALLRSSFSLTHGTAHGGYASVWGLGGWTSFSSREPETEIKGQVAMGQFGADWSFGPWLAGVSIGHSAAEGEYWDEEEGGIESTMTGVYPYVRYDLTERASVWAVTGYGVGDLRIVPESGSGDPVETDIALTMGAGGVRTEVLSDADLVEGLGVSLAVKADVAVMGMSSEETAEIEAVQSHSNRIRLGMEATGSETELGHGATLAPVADVGVLYDGGDAGNGRGMDAGFGVAYSYPACGITADFRGRSLIAHSGSGRREWGVSGRVRYDANPVSGSGSGNRGLTMSLDGGYGGRSSTGGMDAVFDLETVEDMGGRRDGDLPGGRMGAELGYGLRAFENRYTSTPKASLGLTESGSTWGLGWWLTPARGGGAAPDLRGGLELQGGEAKDQRIGLRLNANF